MLEQLLLLQSFIEPEAAACICAHLALYVLSSCVDLVLLLLPAGMWVTMGPTWSVRDGVCFQSLAFVTMVRAGVSCELMSLMLHFYTKYHPDMASQLGVSLTPPVGAAEGPAAAADPAATSAAEPAAPSEAGSSSGDEDADAAGATNTPPAAAGPEAPRPPPDWPLAKQLMLEVYVHVLQQQKGSSSQVEPPKFFTLPKGQQVCCASACLPAAHTPCQ